MSEQFNAGELVAEDVVLAVEPHVGEKLRLAREARGITALDVAQALKLGPRQVAALEAGDWPSLPGNTFVRGFVRNYARIVQVDSAPLMAQLDGSLEKLESNLSVPEMPPATMPQSGAATRRDRAVALSGVLLVVVAALAYLLMPNDLSAWRDSAQSLLDSIARHEESAPPVVASVDPVFPPGSTPQQIMNPQAQLPTEAASTETVQGAAPNAALLAPAPVEVKVAPAVVVPQLRFVFEKESWLEVRDRDNKLLFSQRVAAGTEQTLSGQGPLSLVVGYAPGVRVYWHGQVVDLAPHTRGEVARLVLE